MIIDIVIPVHNEGLFIEGFLKELFNEDKSLQSIRNIIFVDDGSTDNTLSIIKNYKNKKIKLISNKRNYGKGYAMRVGLKKAKEAGAEAVIFMDGDRQHHPKHLSKFIKYIHNHRIVLGYRKLTKEAPYFRKLGNKIAKFLFRVFFNIKRHDLLCGFIAIRKDTYDQIMWESDDYGVEIEISAIIAKKRIPFKEILIDTLYLDIKKGVTLTKAFFISLKIPYWYISYK